MRLEHYQIESTEVYQKLLFCIQASKLKSLCLSSIAYPGQHAETALIDAIVSSPSLTSFRYEAMFVGFGPDFLTALGLRLKESETLQMLYVREMQSANASTTNYNGQQWSDALEGLLRGAAACKSLKTLEVFMAPYGSTTEKSPSLARWTSRLENATAHLLASSKSLEQLLITGLMTIEHYALSTELMTAVRGNYVIQNIKLPVAKSLYEMTCIGYLNRAGRRYLAEHGDPKFRANGVQVLANVHERLDCLFLHLQEVPYLCTSTNVKSDVMLDALGTDKMHRLAEP
jgi:hypothetical protein